MTLNALKVCNNRMEAGSLIHFLICVSYPWPILQGWNLWVLVPTKTRTGFEVKENMKIKEFKKGKIYFWRTY